MARWFALPAGLMILATLAFGADELPTSDQEESFEVEPPLLIPYREANSAGQATEDEAKPKPVVDLERLSKDVERAKRSAISAERLFRMGALAKVEAEQRSLKAIRLEAELESARLAQAKAEVVTQDSSKPDAAAATRKTDDYEAELVRAIQAAHAAAKRREEAELEAAQVNLTRQQKLLSLGSGRKADVAKAERKLAELKATRN